MKASKSRKRLEMRIKRWEELCAKKGHRWARTNQKPGSNKKRA